MLSLTEVNGRWNSILCVPAGGGSINGSGIAGEYGEFLDWRCAGGINELIS